VRIALAATSIALAVVLMPSAASAQRQPFVDHLITFRSLLFGPYGDEGPRAVEELDRLSAALSAWDSSIRAEESRLRTDPGVEARTSLASLFAGRGRLADALFEVDAALAIDPRQRALHTFRGRLLDALGRQAEATAAYQRAWDLERTNAVNAYLAFSTFSPGPSPETFESIPPMVVALLDAQRAVRAAADRSRSKPILELSLIPDGASTSALFAPAAYAGGFDAIAAGNYQEAIARFRAAVARDPLIVDPVSRSEPMSIGIARLRAGRMAEAIAPLESAAAMHRDSSEVHRILGTAYGAIGSDAKAIEHLQLAVRLAPGEERGRLALARVQRDAGRLDEAERSMRETLTVLPGSAEARWTLAGVLEKAGRGIEAARELQAAGSLTVVAGKAALDWQAAEIYDLHQDFDRVAALLRQRVRLEPNNPMVHKQLGLVQSRLGRSGEAFAELAMVDVLGGADAESLTALGQLHLSADRLEDAESALRRAVAIEPDRQEARYALGRTLVRRGRASEGREQLDAFERIRDRAMDEQRRTFEIDKLRAEAAAQSAAGHLSEAAALWAQIVERMPGVAEFQAAAADALAAIGEFQKAALHLEKAATLGAGPAVQLRLAEIYAKLGRREESEQARQAYERRMKDLLKAPPSARP
jgi:tetratricopeptide (TPR) repeat protein